ncbi:NAD(P)-binding protein [Xylaria digitata]|nr:NAD(P)-binding protein [Xylaria digitata]
MATLTKKLTWLITGCSSGFGLSLVRIVQAGGHKVIATSRNASKTPDLVKEVESKGGKWLQLDVNDPLSGANMETMYFGPLRLIRAVLSYQRKRRSSVIANFSSSAALEAQGNMGACASAKGGLDALNKVLAKEVAPFNIRMLTVLLGTFNTNMPNAFVFGKTPLPDDYKGTVAGQIMEYIGSGKIIPNGDKDKVMKTVYQLIAGDGFGVGKEQEKFLPLGADTTARITLVQDQLAHAKEVFGEVTNGVGINK